MLLSAPEPASGMTSLWHQCSPFTINLHSNTVGLRCVPSSAGTRGPAAFFDAKSDLSDAVRIGQASVQLQLASSMSEKGCLD